MLSLLTESVQQLHHFHCTKKNKQNENKFNKIKGDRKFAAPQREKSHIRNSDIDRKIEEMVER